MGIEQEAQKFVEEMAELYFVKKDVKALLSLMTPETSWLGTGEKEVSRNLADAATALQKEFAEYQGVFDIQEQDLQTAKLSDKTCIVYGHIRAIPLDNVVEEQNLHLSAVCIKTDEGMKLIHCNLSRPDYMQETNHFYVSPSKRMENSKLISKMENQERWVKNLIQNVPGGVHQCLNDPNLTLTGVSDNFLEMFGYNESEIETRFQNQFINMIYPNDRAEMLLSIHEQLKTGSTIEVEYRVMSKNDGPIWILDKGRLLHDENGEECFYCLLIEITQRKMEQEELRLSLERHQIIMDQADDIIFEWDITSDQLTFSSNWRKKFGYDPIDNQITKKIPFSENIHKDDMPAFVKIMKDTAAGTPYSETEFRIRDITGHFSWNRIRATAQFDRSGRAIKAVGVIIDISTEKKERMELLEQAHHDALTGLYNKAAIKTKVESKMRENHIDAMQALLIIDVDHFKNVNDTYGHLCGDKVLSDVAQVLKKHFRSSDLIGRIGGDEFLVYLPCIHDKEIVEIKVHSLLEELKQFHPSTDAPALTCSVGAAVFPYKDVDYFRLYQSADLALYHQKNSGRNGISFFTPEMSGDLLPNEVVLSTVNEVIDSELSTNVDQQLAQYTFQMLYHSMDVETAVNRLLEIVGRAYGVSRVYIFENSDDGLTCDNTFEWCATDVTSQINNLKGLRYEGGLKDYFNHFDENGIFYCHDIRTLSPHMYNILEPQGIRSLLQCCIIDRGQFKGYVGFDECKENVRWSKEQIHTLTLVANVLSVFLIKLRLDEKIERLTQQ